MKIKTPLTAILVLLITVGLSGCLGGGGGDEEPKYDEFTGEVNQAGTASGLAQIDPVELTTTVDFPVESDMIKEITFNIEIEDGDQNTNPDRVNQVVITGGGDQSVTVNGGTTPYSNEGKLSWDGTNTLNGTFSLEITVTIEASDDQWPGPLIWRGIPDRGFSYNIFANYTYLQPASE